MRDLNKLEVAAEARALALEVYSLTSRFPPSERFGLGGQMRRAAVSVASNIAEGSGRDGEREFVRFLYVSLGSATELAIQVDLAIALGFINHDDGMSLADRVNHTQRMLNRLTASLRQKLDRAKPAHSSS